jgi:hypothetical protein
MAVAAPEPAAEDDDEDLPLDADEPEAAEELLVEETVVVEAVAAPEPADADGDTEGARLVALNMALNGTSRDETDRYLAENFDLADRAALLDEVYATVEP